MLKSLFGHKEEEGFRLAKEVDRDGRAVVFTTHQELAELKRDQIHSFGKDLRVATCARGDVSEDRAGGDRGVGVSANHGS